MTKKDIEYKMSMINNQFWDIDRNKIVINQYRLNKYLSSEGFYKYKSANDDVYDFLRIVDKRIEKTTPTQMSEFVVSELESCNDPSIPQDDLLESFVSTGIKYFKLEKLTTISEIKNLDVQEDTAEIAYFYFKNCFVEINQANCIVRDYSELNKRIWNYQVIERDITLDKKIGDFQIFSECCSTFNGDLDILSLDSLETSLGYLCHRYKDVSNTKLCLFVDSLKEENIAEDGCSNISSNGGTGKSLLLNQSLKQMMNCCIVDGKQFNPKSQFGFQQLKDEDSVMLIDDVDKKFDIESLYSVITGNIEIERKFKNRVSISFENAPKIAISSNYAVGATGTSFSRRVHIHQLSDYWSNLLKTKQLNPSDVLTNGRMFSKTWSEEQWNQFFTYLFNCIQKYLKNGLVSARQKEYLLAKAMNKIGNRDVTLWIMENIVEKIDSLNAQYDGRGLEIKELHQKFKNWAISENIDKKFFNQRTFTEALKVLVQEYNYGVNVHYPRGRNQQRIGNKRYDHYFFTRQ